MGIRSTPDITAVNYGYISPKLRGRADVAFYDQALDYSLNYKATAQGESQFREGTMYVANTRDNKYCRLIEFVFDTDEAYTLAFTEDYIRFFTNNGIVTETAQDVTNITQADPAVVTYSGADNYSNGDRVIISGVQGMHQVNGREFIVANVNTGNNTFEIQDISGTDIDATSYDAYTSGGEVAVIYEISSPYKEDDLDDLEYAQTDNILYIVHPDFQPRKLTFTSVANWSIGTFNIVGNPFGTTLSAGVSITDITAADPAVVTTGSSHGLTTGDAVLITGVVGMTEVNNRRYTVTVLNATTFQLQDYDSTLNDAYTSGGTVAKYTAFSWPSLVTLFEGRLIYAASDSFRTRLWWSKILVDGSLDNFLTGTNDDDAIIYNLRAAQANRINWISGAEEYLAIGTSGSEHRVSGGGENNAVTPTNISVKAASFNGSKKVRPVRLDNYILFLQRNGRTVRSFEYNALQDGYTAPDRTLLADHIGKSKFKQFSFTSGTPNIIWGVRNDGKMIGLTFDPSQEVVAWHPHSTNGEFESIATIPESDEDDELWLSVKRTINGMTQRFIEYMPNLPDIPVAEEYFTDENNVESDELTYLSALWNVQKTLVHSDAALAFDGRKETAGINLTITGTRESGETVTVTASGSFFTPQMATDRRRIQSPDGGQIEIRTFTSATEIEGFVIYDVESATLTGGEWAFMAQSVGGLWHLEGQQVQILSDGGVAVAKTVTNGEIELEDDAGYVVVGLKYIGIGKTQDITAGDETGRGQAKPKSITHIGVRLRASLGTKFGTDLYNMEHPNYRQTGEVAGRPPRLFSGIRKVNIPDEWHEEKYLYWLHDAPTPSNIQYLQPLMEVNER